MDSLKPLELDNATPEILEVVHDLECYAEAEKVRALPKDASAKTILKTLIADTEAWRYLWTEWEHEASHVARDAKKLLANL